MLPLSGGSDVCEVDVACSVSDASQVAEARRLATALATKCGFDETQIGRLAIVTTEAATNLIKHASGGAILLRGGEGCIELLAVDRGPGMRDPVRCLEDGFSTSGSSGTGLGAIGRLSAAFELFTNVDSGSALLSRMTTNPDVATIEDRWRTAGLCIPKKGEPVCGDAWAIERTSDGLALIVVDGLGHGPTAAAAAREAVRVFRGNSALDPVAILQRVHDSLRSTRGAAVAVCSIANASREVRFTGVGNIAATIVAGEQTRSLVSHNGTAGVEARKIQEFRYELPVGALMIIHSDGIATHWRLAAFPGLAQRDPSLVAGVLFHHFQRGRDDATIVVLSDS